ncbi:MAG: putative glycolipid-binding domain-containing protein [bacterium]
MANAVRQGRAGWVGDETVELELSVDSTQHWRLNGIESSPVEGCLDLNFSPSTNLLPIRRLNLAIGQEAEVQAAWLRFPGFSLDPLKQVYRRIDATTYRYASAGGKFVADLQVNGAGFVTRYPDFWQVEAIG